MLINSKFLPSSYRFIKEEQGNETTNNNEGQQERKKSTIMQEDWLDQTDRNQVIDLSDG